MSFIRNTKDMFTQTVLNDSVYELKSSFVPLEII